MMMLESQLTTTPRRSNFWKCFFILTELLVVSLFFFTVQLLIAAKNCSPGALLFDIGSGGGGGGGGGSQKRGATQGMIPSKEDFQRGNVSTSTKRVVKTRAVDSKGMIGSAHQLQQWQSATRRDVSVSKRNDLLLAKSNDSDSPEEKLIDHRKIKKGFDDERFDERSDEGLYEPIEGSPLKGFPVEDSFDVDTIDEQTSEGANNNDSTNTNNNSWTVINWDDPISTEDESRFSCTTWSHFKSRSGEEADVCLTRLTPSSPSSNQANANANSDTAVVCSTGNYFTDVWYRGYGGGGGDEPTYVEIGAGNGACILEILLETSANVLAFEPHPNYVYGLRKTMAELDVEFRNRVTLVPIGLADESMHDMIYHTLKSSTANVQLRGEQQQQLPQQKKIQLSIYAERFDTVLENHPELLPSNAKMIINMDVLGWECKILSGINSNTMGERTIELIKLKWDATFAAKKNFNKCDTNGNKNYLEKLRKEFGFQVWRSYANGKYGQYLPPGKKPVFNGVEIYATRKSSY